MKKRLLAAETNRAMFEQLDRDMERRIQTLGRLIEALPETPPSPGPDRLHHSLPVPYQTQMQSVFPGTSGGWTARRGIEHLSG